jgi:hypothetical protein
MKANQLRHGQFFDYLGMVCRCEANDRGGQPVRFGYWDCGTYRMRYCGAFCEVSALPFCDWDQAITTYYPAPRSLTQQKDLT